MKNLSKGVFVVMFTLPLTLLLTGCGDSTSHPLKAGFATIDITPKGGTVYDSLYAKALVLQQGSSQGAIVVCDLGGVPDKIVNEARSMASDKTGIPTDHISIAATHTHSAGRCEGLATRIAQAIIDAHASIEPVTTSTGTATQKGLAFNRRFLMVDGTVRMNPSIDPVTKTSFENGYPYLNPEIIKPIGPVDTDLPIILFKDQDEQPIGSLTCFAMHTCVFGPEYSADFPGYQARELSNNFGEEFISIFGEGPCGDINHWDVNKSGDGQNGPGRSEEIGMELASTIMKAVPTLTPQEAKLQILTRIVNVPIQPVTDMNVAWARSAKADNFEDFGSVAFNNRGFLAGVRARKILRLAEMHENNIESLPLEVKVYRMDDQTAVITLPGELFVELGLAIKENSPFENTMIIELANNDIGYVPPLKSFSEGGYEVTQCWLIPGGGEMLVEAACEMLNQLGS